MNDIRSRRVNRDDVFRALREAKEGPVEEGAVGAGTGTVAFGYKGGIGTSSRKVPSGHTVGVLVQPNYGGRLMIDGAPFVSPGGGADGSVMIVIGTDAPLDARNLKRLGMRAMMGIGRTGSAGSNGSGDYAIAFSTQRDKLPLANDDVSPLFQAVIEATEEAVLNSLFTAETMTGNGHTVLALPLQGIRAGPRQR